MTVQTHPPADEFIPPFRPDSMAGSGRGGFVPLPLWPDPSRPSAFQAQAPDRLGGLGLIKAPAPPAPPEPAPQAAEPPPPPPPPRPAPPPVKATEPATPRLSEAALAAARAEGRAEAEAELAQERARMAQATQALTAALARLSAPPAAEVDALSDALRAAVARMAAERAGFAIDEQPLPFARRIAQLADRAAHGLSDLRVHLHPDDLAAITPVIQAQEDGALAGLAAAHLVPDATLCRGDADIQAPGIRLADLIRPEGVPEP